MRYRYYYDDEINELINEIYFIPSVEFPIKGKKDIARQAMLSLWNSETIKIHGRVITKQEIRYLMVNEMLYENLVDAVELFSTKRYQEKGVNLLSWLILSEILSADEVANLQYEFDFEGGDAA